LHPYWLSVPLGTLREEAHYGDRIVRCFADRVTSVWTLFARSAERFAGHEAVVCESTRWSYGELAHRVERAAWHLHRRGIVHGARVAMLISNRAEFVLAFLAVQRLGAIAVPISVREQASGVQFMLEQCEASLLIYDEALADRTPAASAFASLSVEQWISECQQPLAGAALAEPPEPREEDTAVILYTSGTTGRPKGAMLTHLNIVHSVMHFVKCLDWDEHSRSIMAVPASHVTGLIANVITAIGAGACTIIMPSFKAATFLQLAERERLSHTILVPAMYNLCLLEPGFEHLDLSAWKVGGFGGAPMPSSTIDALARRLPHLGLHNAYGATETTSPTTLMPREFTRDHLDSVGLPLPCAEVRIMDDDGRELPRGHTGEVWIAGPMVVRGYWNNPEATAKEFTAGFWHSGDLGAIDEQGFVRLFDRKKDMLNRGGYKIYSVEVENCLMAAPGVLEAAVVGRPCPVLGERVVAHVVMNEAAPGSEPAIEAALRAHCANFLADYKVPEAITVRREPLPRNANGKVMKRLLRDQAEPAVQA
jgi:O-succinylbenzoic acid--CoA ligase